jgi:hypothetical protein
LTLAAGSSGTKNTKLGLFTEPSPTKHSLKRRAIPAEGCSIQLYRIVCMNPDQMLIHSAYEDAIKKLYSQLFDSFTQSGDDAGQVREAEQNFATGIGYARKALDRATALLA